jgi:hypothetical protein
MFGGPKNQVSTQLCVSSSSINDAKDEKLGKTRNSPRENLSDLLNQHMVHTLDCMSSHYTKEATSDVVFILKGNQRVFAAKWILVEFSPYFERTLIGDFDSKNKKEIPLQVTPETPFFESGVILKALIQFLFKGSLELFKVSSQGVIGLDEYLLAQYFQMKSVAHIIEHMMVQKLDLNAFWKCLELSSKNGHKMHAKLEDIAFEYFNTRGVQDFQDIDFESQGLKECGLEVILKLMKEPVISSNPVFALKFVQKWCQNHSNMSSVEFRQLLNLIEWEKLTETEFLETLDMDLYSNCFSTLELMDLVKKQRSNRNQAPAHLSLTQNQSQNHGWGPIFSAPIPVRIRK